MISTFLTLSAILAFWVVYFDPVTELPFGIHDEVQTIVNIINALSNAAPWLATVLNVIIICLSVAVALWIFDKVLWVIQLIRG